MMVTHEARSNATDGCRCYLTHYDSLFFSSLPIATASLGS
jgi:hypothetical protein